MASMYQEHGKKLKRLIRDAGLDQKEVAVRVDVSPQAVSGWTTGKSPPKLPMLLKLDRVLGGDGRVFAIYGETKPRAIQDVIAAAMEAGLTEIRSAVDVLEAAVSGEVRSQIAGKLGVVVNPAGPIWADLRADPKGRVPRRPGWLSLRWRQLCARNGATGIRLHDLRHLHATTLIDEGVPLTAVSKRLGHSRTSTTTDIYGSGTDVGEAQAIAAIARAFNA